MNNYQNYPGNYNQNMSPYKDKPMKMPQKPCKSDIVYPNYMTEMKSDYNTNLYDPYQGFIRGNMFPQLYDPYTQAEPFEIQPINEQAELLTKYDALGFATIDLDLYLDVNPNDRNAIELYNQYNMQKKSLKEMYESKYGPLTLESESLNTYPWAWDNKPWPWEN